MAARTAKPELFVNASDLLSFALITPQIADHLTLAQTGRLVTFFVIFSGILSPIWLAGFQNDLFLGSQNRVLNFIFAESFAIGMAVGATDGLASASASRVLAYLGIALFIGTRVFAIIHGIGVR